jgi:HAMP domain-containing protein
MKLRYKIVSGFLILALMLSIAGIWSIYELKSIGSSVQDLLEENYKSINAAKTMIEALEREDSGVLLLILGKWEEGRHIISSADSLFKIAHSIAANNITIPNEKNFIDVIRIRYNEYKGLWERPIVDTEKEGNLNWYFEDVHNDLMTLNDSTMFKTSSDLKNKANRAIMPGIVAILSALVFTLLFNFFVNYYFISPVVKITNGIRKFLAKRVPFRVEVETKDEIYDLAASIDQLCAQLHHQEMKP